MKGVFEIEWKDDLGEGWMNVDNLRICLHTQECCGSGLITDVKAVKEKQVFVCPKCDGEKVIDDPVPSPMIGVGIIDQIANCVMGKDI